ncbi:MAG: hypothetical protein RMJ17_02795 [Candidatus Aenigmarchaeota archaeon]|nr:hypothetical protein [Candidatus Aenigmarchaeota archaeon]MDW8149495.1 hypothetical protein [Candidatus Aenigmarchaeota archaeon]
MTNNEEYKEQLERLENLILIEQAGLVSLEKFFRELSEKIDPVKLKEEIEKIESIHSSLKISIEKVSLLEKELSEALLKFNIGISDLEKNITAARDVAIKMAIEGSKKVFEEEKMKILEMVGKVIDERLIDIRNLESKFLEYKNLVDVSLSALQTKLKEIETIPKSLTSTLEEMVGIKKDIEKTFSLINNLERKLSSVEEVEKLKSKIDDLNRALSLVERNKEQLIILSRGIEMNKMELNKVKNNLESFIRYYEEKLLKFNEVISKLNIDELVKKLDLESLKKDIMDVKSNIEKTFEYISQHKKDIVSLFDEINSVKSIFSTLEEMKKKMLENEATVFNVSDKLKIIETDVKFLKENISTLNINIDEIKTKILATENALISINEDFENFKTSIKELDVKRVEYLKNTVLALETALSSQKKNIEELSKSISELNELKNKFNILETKFLKLEAKIKELEERRKRIVQEQRRYVIIE